MEQRAGQLTVHLFVKYIYWALTMLGLMRNRDAEMEVLSLNYAEAKRDTMTTVMLDS